MARRMLKLLTPVLVGLVAVILGFLAMGQSYAGVGGVAPVDSTVNPTATYSTPNGGTTTATTAPAGTTAPANQPTQPPQGGPDLGPDGCANCMVPPVD